MTSLRKKLSEHFELGKEFPLQDLMLFLSGVIKQRKVRAWVYDQNIIDTGKNKVSSKKSSSKKEIEDKLIVDHYLGWKKGEVYDACMDFIKASLVIAVLPVLIDKSETEESFLSLLANRFEWHLRKNHQQSDIGRLFNNAVDILKEEKDFVKVKSSKKKAQIVWGLSKWETKRSILEKEAIEKLKIKFPSYAHLKKFQNPNSDKSAPLISNNDLQKILFEILEKANQYLYFVDIFEIIKDSISFMEARVISASGPIGSIDKQEDEETGKRKLLFIDNIQGVGDPEEKAMIELSDEHWNEPVQVFVDSLKLEDQIILKDFLTEDMRPKQIADKYEWARNSTVHFIIKKTAQKIKLLGNGDPKEVETIIGLIKKCLSKINY